MKVYTEDGVYKSGTVLFFAKKPEKYFEQAIIRCVSFRGLNKRFIADDKPYGGSLYKQYQSAMEWLRNKLDVGYDIEGQGRGPRKEVWEIPETALKEAIINALSHRDYYEKGAVTMVELFDDRVEITNPGELLSAVKKDFGKKSLSRNPLIFDLFNRMTLVEKVASGIPRIRDLMKQQNLPEPEFQTEGMFTVTLMRPVKNSKKSKVKSKVKSRVKSRVKIIELINENNKITIPEIAETIELSLAGVEKHIASMKKEGTLKRIGPDKGGHWKITE